MTTSMRRYRLRWLAIVATVIFAATAAISGVTASSALAAGPCTVTPDSTYFAASCWGSSVPLTGMTVAFTVPPNPSSTGKSNFSIWGGLQSSNASALLQNVLVWSGSSWSFYPEYYTVSKNTNYPAIPVSAGQTLVSKTSSSDCGSAGQCIWTLTAEDVSSGKSSVSQAIVSTSTFNTLFGGVLEVHSASGCLSLPSDGHIAFRDISVENLNFQYPTPQFYAGTPNRQCSMTASATATSTDFLWTP